MGGSCSSMVNGRALRVLVGEPEGKSHSEDLDLDGERYESGS